MTDTCKLVDRGIKIEFRLLAAIEGGFCLLALLALQVEHAEHLFDSVDLVAGDNIVGLAKRPHDREHGFEQLRLHNAQAANERLPQQEAGTVAAEASTEEPWQTTHECADAGADNCEPQLGLLFDLYAGCVMAALAFFGNALRLCSRGLEIGRFLNRAGRCANAGHVGLQIFRNAIQGIVM